MRNDMPTAFTRSCRPASGPFEEEAWKICESSQESLENYRRLVELSQDAIFIHDVSGTIRFVNQAGWETLGAQGPEELIDRNLFEFVHPDDLPVVLHRSTRLHQTKRPVETAAHRIITLDSREIYLESAGGPFTLEGEPCVQVVSRDVTSRKQMEKELEKERRTLEKVITLNPMPIFLYDSEGRYVMGNRAYLELFGAAPSSNYCFFEDAVLIEAGFRGELMKLKNGGTCHIPEVWYNPREADPAAPDRSVCVSFSGFPVYSEAGRLESYVGMLRDITPQKIAEEELRVSEEKFSKAFHLSPMIMAVTGLHDGRLIDFNEAFERFIGCARDEILGKTSLEIGFWERPEDRERFIDALVRGDLPIQSTIRRRSGERRVGRFLGERLTIGRESCLLAVIEDITEQLEAEKALQRSQESYRQIFDSVTEMISVHDPESGKILDVNRAWLNTMGYSKEQVIGRTIDFFCVQEEPHTARDAHRWLEKAVREGPQKVEWVARNKKGRVMWHEANLKPAFIGGWESIVAVVRDITERKAMEAQLNKERNTLERIIDMNPYAIAFYDQDGRPFRTNRAFERLYHTDSFESYSLFEDPVLTKQGYRERLQALRAGQPVSVPEFRDNPRWRRKSLPDRPMTLRGVAFPVRPFEEAPATYVAMIEDLTELDSTRYALLESDTKYRSVVENSNDGIVVLQGDAIRYANPQMAAMIGVPLRDLLDRRFVDCIPSEAPARVLEFVRARGDGTGGGTIDTVLEHRDGSGVEAEVTANTIPFEGESAHLVVFRDITDRKVYERRVFQSQKMEAIGTLAGGIAHDFNNILTPILGFTELTMGELDPGSKPHRNLGQVLTAAQRAQELVKQILAFSRQRSYEKKPFQMAPLVAEVTKLIRASLPATIDIKVDMPRKIRPIVADPTGVHQILMNLCTNGYHAMKSRGGVLSLTFEETDVGPGVRDEGRDIAPGTYLKMAVCDTGHGMEREVLEKVFRPYFTTKPEGEGTGMGLSVVHGIVKSHDGLIRVYSQPGKGTAFHVFLPMFRGMEPDADDRPAPQLSDPALRGNERVLVVDDEESILAMLQESLGHLGYEVTARSESEEALALFQRHPECFDVVITDQTMPHMTGIELARRVMRTRPGMPVILLTGYSEIATRVSAKAAGVSEFLMKPVIMSRLAGTLRRVLDGGPRTETEEP